MQVLGNARPDEAPLWRTIVAAGTLLFACSAARHLLFRSTAYDLGIFDQAVYLISRNGRPISSIMGFHIFGDHAAWILYLLALPYVAYPSALWLLFVQAWALALGAWPMWRLARQAGLPAESALLMARAYLLYPVLFNANLFDFHPEVIAVPLILCAVLAARLRRPVWFGVCVVLVLGCKEVLGLTLVGVGAWLFLCEERRCYGVAAALSGTVWFVLVATVVVPIVTGTDAAHAMGDDRYAYLGATLSEIIRNALTRPSLFVGHAFSISSLGYLAGLLAPLAWGLRPRHLAPLLAAIPALTLNLLADSRLQRHLTNQYSLPIFPFLLLAALSALAANDAWIRSHRVILGWCTVGFLVFARYPRLVEYAATADTWRATHEALSRIDAQAGMLTDNCLAVHLAHRRTLQILTDPNLDPARLPGEIGYVMLNERHPCSIDAAAVRTVSDRLRTASFQVAYERDGVVLLARTPRPVK